MKHVVIAVFIGLCAFVATLMLLSQFDNSLNRNLKDAVLGFIQEDYKELKRLEIQKEQAQVKLKISEIEDQQQAIPFYRRLKNYGGLAAMGAILGAILIMSYGLYHKYSVHNIKIGKHSELKVRYKDLGNIGVVSNGLVLSEQLRAYSQTEEKALEMSLKLSDVVTRQLQVLLGKGIFGRQAQEMPPQPALSTFTVPAFRDMLHELYGSQAMCLGFKLSNGEQISGTFKDIYSSFIAGATGSGKTVWLGCVIAQSVLVFDAESQVLDPHYPDNESLLFLLGNLADLPNIVFINDRQEHIIPRLYSFNDRITARLEGEEEKTRPLVLCVDELAYWMKTKFANAIGYVMERIALEGRKINVFLFASSQSTLASRTGKDSVMRDSLASSYVFKIKPRIANTLLQDKESAKLVKDYCQDIGTALFSDTKGHNEVVKVPYATRNDMNTVFDLITDGNAIRKVQTLKKVESDPRELLKSEIHKRQPELPELQPDTEIDTFFNEMTSQDGNNGSERKALLTPELCKIGREARDLSQNKLAKLTGIPQAKLSRFESGKNVDFDNSEIQLLRNVLFDEKQSNVIDLNRYVKHPES